MSTLLLHDVEIAKEYDSTAQIRIIYITSKKFAQKDQMHN